VEGGETSVVVLGGAGVETVAVVDSDSPLLHAARPRAARPIGGNLEMRTSFDRTRGGLVRFRYR